MAKSAVRLEIEETWELLERWGEYMRDGHMVNGYPTGHEGRGAVMEDGLALRIDRAMNDLMLDSDMLFIAVAWFFRGEKLVRRREDNVPVVYYVQRNYAEISARFKKSSANWAQTLVTSGVGVLHGYLMCERNLKVVG